MSFEIESLWQYCKIRPDTPEMTNGLIQNITVEESISIQWVKHYSLTFSSVHLTRVAMGKMSGMHFFPAQGKVREFCG